MSGLDSIPIRVEGAIERAFRTENLRPLLRQVQQALHELCENGTETIIDLSAMPFSSHDEADLREQLGTGEVSATVDALGPSLVQETALPGVWLVEHKDANERRLTLHLTIANVPQILVTPLQDIVDGLEALNARDEADPSQA